MDIGWKIASAGSMAAAAFVASKIAEGGWKAVTGKDVPHEDDDDVQLVPLLAFAAASAVLVALAQRFAMKGTKKWYGAREISRS
ncbi:DUF4235 domain-containing protein [Actinomyces polynesiensis]|uniref:DUF4235 domain-containing protein n=1 Tax=Actinomyces polynesiensis TaxID=1325934 RepID=UPI0005B8E5C0|nr:DUF4235 domain-containing protein [Actinomyces polynesiensis]